MINLIPSKEKKEIAWGFYYRLMVLLFVITGVSFLVILVAILPSYFISSVKVNLVKAKLEMQKNEPVPLPQEQTLATIKDVNSKLTLVEKTESNKFIISQKVINAVLVKKVPGIQITDISYENSTPNSYTSSKKISVEGIATSRSVLLMFRQALEDDATFKNVNLPISNFIKESNIQFYLSLIPS